MAGDRKDELAHEQTVPAAASVDPAIEHTATALPQSRVAQPRTTPTMLGRYRIERELGAGGMGVVYAAFDPDLERRVALKVLLSPDGQDAHKQRLLREARAMARLTHPNVVTVHEVQTVDGRDYVAMELVEGQSLADWLRAERRSEAEILAAFVAAGRGLAAAHAAGMVHRDFKPHNVLRSSSGRIAVTDFGLAREAHADPLAVTGVASPPVPGTAVGSATPSTPLAGLTMTGSVLGTPAYMAPEQWTGGTVTPATDQFAFCVALWEALTGTRPFHGDTLDILKRAVELGPAKLDDSQVPARLRPILRRGLDPIATRRWPSMDALLAELAPAARKRAWLPLAFAGVGLAGFGVYLATRSEPAASPPAIELGCPPSALAAPPPLVDRPVEQRLIQRDLDAWQAARAQACDLPAATRSPQLACLDHVMSRLTAVHRGVAQLPKDADATELRYLIDPAICKTPPQLAPTSPALAETLAWLIREEATPGPTEPAAARALIDRVTGDPCAAALARMYAVRIDSTPAREQVLADAEQDAARCPDERVRADAAIAAAYLALARSSFGIPSTAKLKLAAAAVERIPQVDLLAEIQSLWMQQAFRADEPEQALVHAESARVGFKARGRLEPQVEVAMFAGEIAELLDKTGAGRSARDTALAQLYAEAETALGRTHPTTLAFARQLAMRQFFAGDALAAQRVLEKLRVERPLLRQTRKVRVRVLDQQGKPVAGAVVTAAPGLFGAGTLAAYPDDKSPAMRSSLTPPSGEVVFEAAREGLVIAQLGELRSPAATIEDAVTLTLEPTSRIEGKVELRGAPSRNAVVAVGDLRLPPTTRYELLAPLRPDGSFVVEGVPRTKVRLYASVATTTSRTLESKTLTITAPIVRDVTIAVAESHARMVDIVVRSTVNTAPSAAQVWLLPGTVRTSTLDKFSRDTGRGTIRIAKPPKDRTPPVVGMKPGDLVARMEAPATASVCAIGLPSETDEPDLDRKIRDNLAKLEVRCTQLPPAASSVIVEVPPWPRLE